MSKDEVLRAAFPPTFFRREEPDLHVEKPERGANQTFREYTESQGYMRWIEYKNRTVVRAMADSMRMDVMREIARRARSEVE